MDANNQHLREFAWAAFEIDTSKADLPSTRYVPHRTPESVVRFKDGSTAKLGINEIGRTVKWDESKGEQVKMTWSETTQGPALWVKVADGAWAKDGHWGGYLQVTCAAAEGKWIDSKDGWLTTVSSKSDPVAFYDMGNYYEIWQKDRDNGKPLVVEGDRLRFVKGATPGKFNLHDGYSS
ncbi:hypothetical protein [Streptomyces sp. NBC_00691]|uniref:hypothetical protein n=1 Tax=Streptomyces sp. NBC_00691 TaxID=2903671 RepID=UPI002E3517C8|nr:hypothetical protein [Streptomyces sp. NBC_00691]